MESGESIGLAENLFTDISAPVGLDETAFPQWIDLFVIAGLA
jgi:hypothetical protein